MTDKQIRDEAMRKVMWRVGNTNNGVTRYIADAVANQVVRDERAGNGWIPVDEKLPEAYNDVLVTNGKYVYMDSYDPMDGCFEQVDNVIAWMPLPEPYNPD